MYGGRCRPSQEIKLNAYFSWLLGGSTQGAGSKAWALPDGKQLTQPTQGQSVQSALGDRPPGEV